ncbi:DUF975 family protein [Limosilactobacillus pontis]|uniref:DUF975 family protein n=1 Tax=Limosilactobacillus pontis TaxID=35787 RepID=UPI002F267224
MKTRNQLKAEARELLAGNWLTAIKLNIVPVVCQVITWLIITGMVAGLTYYFTRVSPVVPRDFSNDAGSNNGTNSGQSFIGDLITTYFLLSVDFALIDWVRTKVPTQTPFKDAFQTISGKYILPVFVLYVIQRVLVFLWSLLLVIPGIIKAFAYSQTFYIYKDVKEQGGDTDRSYFDYVTMSRQLMDGNKWELFVLRLSFLGWDILGVLTAGIGFIWITPYKQMTYMNYYVSLVGDRYHEWGQPSGVVKK